MKQIGLWISAFILTANLYSQTYQKLIDSTNKWNYLDQAFTTCCGGEARTYSLFFTTDTIISDTVYKKVMSKIIKYNSTDTVYAGGIREDIIAQSVYVRTGESEERKIYSFDHKTGDTISIDTTYWKDAYTIRYVKSIDIFDFDGFQGKKIGICDTTFRTNMPHISPSETYTDFWYEGIGSLKCLFDLTHIGGFGIDMELLCFWSNNNQVYQNPDWSVCEYAIITGIEEEYTSKNFFLYPNPTSDIVEIKADKKVNEISVIDMNGNLLIKQEELILNLSNLPDGIYFVKLQMSNNQIVVRKIIKNGPFKTPSNYP
ncbi:MAG: T9SS type A sorting domain-containing protein [Bacteroidales bacterium]|nr:T9SS type A sorting domain-containing protein [Bacteroidales bacterium]